MLIRENFITRANLKNNSKLDYSLITQEWWDNNYKGTQKTRVPIICLKYGCQKCNSSKGELAIIEYLNKNNIKYKHEYFIPALNRKRFDFYLEENNTAIEFDGRQHFEELNIKRKVKEIIMNKQEYLLQVLQEEAGEIIQAASKCNRFGPESFNPELPPELQVSNHQQLENEIHDLLGVVELIIEETGLLKNKEMSSMGIMNYRYLNRSQIDAKKNKVKSFM